MNKKLIFGFLIFNVIILSCSPVQKETLSNSEAKEVFNPEAKLKELGIDLPSPAAPVANFVNAVRVDNLLFLSGNGPLKSDGKFITGKLGENLTIEEGYEAARLTGINQIAILKSAIGDLSKVKRIVKVLGMVNSSSNFTDHPKVINGYSDLMVEVFGDRGKHARAAVGMGSLPFDIAVEIEMIVEVE
jgi:enamine deaminase RidA (YjgF/YER057c/UK114 family)|tara:strand:+ start:377 stop:940 length:564 start_codon:yes stop_codon:yes gene_type:complete